MIVGPFLFQMAAPRSVPEAWVFRVPIQQVFLQNASDPALMEKVRKANMAHANVCEFEVLFGDMEDYPAIEYTVRLKASHFNRAKYNKLVEYGYISLASFNDVHDHADLAQHIGLKAMRSQFPGEFIDAGT